MIVLKKWKCPRLEDEQDWFEIPLEKALEVLSHSGLSWAWSEGRVQQMLEDGYEMFSPSAIYKKKD